MLDAITVNFWTPSKPLGIYLFLERSGGETLFWKSLKFRFSKLVIVIYVYKKISECHVFATIWKKFHDFSLISETLLFGNTMSRIFFKIKCFFCFEVFTLKNHQISCLFRGFLRSFDTICTPSTLLSHRKLLASDHSVSKIMEYRNYFVKQFTKRTKKHFNEITKISCHGVSVNPCFSLFSNIIRSVSFGKPQKQKN